MTRIWNKHKQIHPHTKNFDVGAGTPLKRKVFVMMSGGVDSSVAVYLLSKNKKYEVFGCFIKGYNIDGCQEKDVEDARRVAEFLGIPFYVINLEKEYKKRVVDYMIDGYRKGITPNPDVMCNKEIKFGLFLNKAVELGADYVASGHYIRLRNTKKCEITKSKNGKDSYFRKNFVFRSLYQAKDLNKDQSYFLWTLAQEQLKYCLFPIGDYTKPEIRKIAKKAGLPTAEKKDSQGICFLGKISFRDFLKEFLSVKKGNVITVDGKKIGTHDGVWFYTIGQRHIGLGDAKIKMENEKGNRKPLYVAGKNFKKNELIVAQGNDNLSLFRKEIKITNLNFINQQLATNIQKGQKEIEVLIRVRYRQPLAKAQLILFSPLSKKGLPAGRQGGGGFPPAFIRFYENQKFIAPGQSAVFYSSKGEMLGGGVIQ